MHYNKLRTQIDVYSVFYCAALLTASDTSVRLRMHEFNNDE